MSGQIFISYKRDAASYPAGSPYDHLFLSVLEAKVDFYDLPGWDGTREINHHAANISEELLARPFEGRGLQLKAFVHRFELSDALTKGVSIA
jgi:hypothetical protein